MKLDARTTAFVFPGQGSQAVGMGRDLAAQYSIAKQTFEEADSILHVPFSKTMWDGPDTELNDTINTQPALFVHSIASFRVFAQLHPNFVPAALAGHSLGELSALAAAEALSFESGLRLVRRRGELMKKAGEMNPGGMAAIMGLDIAALEKVCAEASREGESVQVANDNSPGQVVISGAKAAVERAVAGAKAAGAKRAIPLAVSIAAHSKLMASIQDEWNEAVNAAGVKDAKIRIVGNVSAKAMQSAADLRVDVQSQMQSRVRWVESVQLLAEQGVTNFVEVGTGNVLIGLIRRIAPSAVGYPLGNPSDFAALE
jgi:[acyl-carrier-protein] S-malonyltransferase